MSIVLSQPLYSRRFRMIVGELVLDPLQAVLQELASLPMNFYLTGSRFFRSYTDSSDYDFFTADDPDTEELLLKRGFVVHSESSYLDSETNKVLRHPLGIDVQLVVDVFRKSKAQAILLPFFRHRPMDKGAARTLWDHTLAHL